MPFESQKQRGLFYAAENNPAVRARTGISKSVADKMTAHDEPGKLPKYAKSNPQHNPNGYGSGDERYHGMLAKGAGGGKIRPQPNTASSLPGSSDQSARGPGPRSAPDQGLATWGALRGIKRPASPHVSPRGAHPGAMGASKQAPANKTNPKGNPVGMSREARRPIEASAPRQMR